MGIRFSALLISDNLGIQEYIQKEYKRSSVLIAYGGDQATKVVPNAPDFFKY